MVNTLSGSVCAYRKETVKPRFIRIDEVMALLDVTQDEASMSISLLILIQHLRQMVIQMMRSSPWNIQMPLQSES